MERTFLGQGDVCGVTRRGRTQLCVLKAIQC